MRIAISGASGFVGRQLVPLLEARGAELLLIGREPILLQQLFPQCAVAGYDEIATLAKGFDQFLHLATLNNDDHADYAAFEAVNVDLAIETYRAARQAGINRFIYSSSIHALEEANSSNYARSKREAMARLAEEPGPECQFLCLAAVIGKSFAGRLAPLNAFPEFLRAPLLQALAALKPTVRVETIAEHVLGNRFDRSVDADLYILTERQNGNPVYALFARLLDLAAAIVGIGLFFWLLLAIALIIRLDSPGPALFRQARVGRQGTVFTCLKFRTMRIDTPERASHEVSQSSVTRVGGFLRRTKLDELPQLFNVLVNQMSLVGPRPCLTTQAELISERKARSVLDIKPGITGLAQIKGIDMSDPVRLAEWDRRYLDLRCVSLDLRILIATARGRGRGDRIVG